jgi:signal transduction histidine kinase
LAGQAVTITATAVTIVLTALVMGPPIFDDHLRRAGHGDQPLVVLHAAEAFRSAGLISLLVGLVMAGAGALGLGLFVSRRIAAPLRDCARAAARVAAGDYSAAVAVAHPTAEVAVVQRSLNDMAAQLARTEAVRARMLADLAHELRTPIASLRALLEAIEDGVSRPDGPTLAALRRQTDRLEQLARDVAEVSAAEQGHLNLRPTAMDVASWLDGVAVAARERARGTGVRLVLELAPGLATLHGDPSRLTQALDNLLANAVRHTPAGGQVVLRATRGSAGLRLEVVDTGDGLAAEQLPHVFDRFYRTDAARDRDHGGVGIGLTISRAIVRAHGGDVTASSAGLGRGATFAVSLPALPP